LLLWLGASGYPPGEKLKDTPQDVLELFVCPSRKNNPGARRL